MMILLITFLFACSTDDDYRGSWYLHKPTWEASPPQGDLTWAVRSGASLKLNLRFKKALDEWRLSMGCIFEPREVDPDEQADIEFNCSEPPGRSFEDGNGTDQDRMVTIVEKDKNTRNVFIKPVVCDIGGDMVFMHAAGHGLGLADIEEVFPNVMSQASLLPRYWNHDVPGMERDGLRIWAYKKGASGCGTRDPKWSWEIEPERYRIHPKTPIAGSMPKTKKLNSY